MPFLCWGPQSWMQDSRTPNLDTALQMGSLDARAKGQNPLPQPAGHSAFDESQDADDILDYEHALPSHVQLFIHSQILLCRDGLNDNFSHSVLISGIVLTQVKHLALGLVDPHEIVMGPSIKFVQVLLDGILSFCCVKCTAQLHVITKLAESALNLTVHVTDADTK
ncbi:hypothetical protein WISP_125504 [Willisornis vidua]|uniref:Uncharacterized protein n=1 Tax=Willisornis vidua TaxID=1566151 RepID=A0ABQ9CW93_9PASS|nr:hypothetical protein WISP_125504 [Willisornis vidua]